MIHYSCKLLFQWRPIRNGIIRKRRVCEERIVVYKAKDPKSALKWAKEYGKSEEYVEGKSNGQVCFEFVGVLELKDISLNFNEGEVWSEIKEMIEPFERRDQIIPKESELDALKKVSPKRPGRLSYY
jgi:hypothetical protein